MFLVRATTSFIKAANLIELSICGRRNPFGKECYMDGWDNVLKPFRVLHILSAYVMVLNGLSLIWQYKYPNSSLFNRGNKQLFIRGMVRSIGIPVQIAYCFLKFSILTGTEYERQPIEGTINHFRALLFIPIIAASLFVQWFTSKCGSDKCYSRVNWIVLMSYSEITLYILFLQFLFGSSCGEPLMQKTKRNGGYKNKSSYIVAGSFYWISRELSVYQYIDFKGPS